MRRVLAFSLLALILAPPAAFAQHGDPVEDPEAPPETATEPTGVPGLGYEGPAARISRGEPLTFAVRTDAPPGSVIVRVSSSDDTDEEGLLAGNGGEWIDETASPVGEGVQAWSAPASSILRQRPGHYFWQAYLEGEAAEAAEEAIGPVRELVVTLPLAYRGRGKLFPKFGRRGGTTFYLSSAGFPGTVSGKRFQMLAKTTAKRWGLRALRWTSAGAGAQDGYNVAGFSSKVPSGVLGVQTDYMLRGRVIERDLALRADESWTDGPEYPELDEIDLESVLLHELGHMAGNKKHRRQCANSPMVEALGEGEWWRGARDHWFGECHGGARAARASAGALVHRVVRMD